MEGKYPIMINDALAGTLEVTKKGAMTVFDARCKGTDELLRLSVYGDGGEGYLGVMVPEGGEMRLRRSMSPLSMKGFPEEIVAAGPAGRGNAGQQGTAEEPAASPENVPEPMPPEKMADKSYEAAPCETDCGEAASPMPPETGNKPEPEGVESPCEKCPERQEADPSCDMSPEPAEAEGGQSEPTAPPKTENVPEEAEDLCWYASPDGALVCFDGAHSLIALPLKDERVPKNIPGQPRQIEGRDYLVYVTKNGRIVS